MTMTRKVNPDIGITHNYLDDTDHSVSVIINDEYSFRLTNAAILDLARRLIVTGQFAEYDEPYTLEPKYEFKPMPEDGVYIRRYLNDDRPAVIIGGRLLVYEVHNKMDFEDYTKEFNENPTYNKDVQLIPAKINED